MGTEVQAATKSLMPTGLGAAGKSSSQQNLIKRDETAIVQKRVKGRNTKHCSLYEMDDLKNRFVLYGMMIVTFLYMGVFIKVYILADNEEITYTLLSPLAVGPT